MTGSNRRAAGEEAQGLRDDSDTVSYEATPTNISRALFFISFATIALFAIIISLMYLAHALP